MTQKASDRLTVTFLTCSSVFHMKCHITHFPRGSALCKLGISVLYSPAVLPLLCKWVDKQRPRCCRCNSYETISCGYHPCNAGTPLSHSEIRYIRPASGWRCGSGAGMGEWGRGEDRKGCTDMYRVYRGHWTQSLGLKVGVCITDELRFNSGFSDFANWE